MELVIALLKDRELFVNIFRDSRVFILIVFFKGGRHIFVFNHALSASAYDLHNLHQTSHIEICKLLTVGLQWEVFSHEL